MIKEIKGNTTNSNIVIGATTFNPDALILEINTGLDNNISQFSLYVSGTDIVIDWGDGTSDTVNSGTIVHNYGGETRRFISITGGLSSFSFFGNADRNKLINIVQWGNHNYSSFNNLFNGCGQLQTIKTTTAPTFSATNFGNAFSYNTYFNADLSNWDMSKVTILSQVFRSCSSFNGDVSTWDTISVTAANLCFHFCTSFNQDISWKPATTTNTWAVDTVYTKKHQVLGTDGKVYRAISEHTSTSATEPIIGVDWATVWELDSGYWNLSNCLSLGLYGSGLSVENTDKLIVGLKSLEDNGWTIRENGTIDLGTKKYGADPAAIVAHDWLTTPVASGGKGWTIISGGLV